MSPGKESSAPRLRKTYDADFRPAATYRETLPDTQNLGPEAIQGTPAAIDEVGVEGVRLPLWWKDAGQPAILLETRVSGSVRLPEGVRGINMSRIPRAVYSFADQELELADLETILRRMCAETRTTAGRLRLDCSYPLRQASLRSGMEGWQYYPLGWEAELEPGGRLVRRVYFEFVYSSACPGSADLADHAEETRGAYAIPHSQRSRADLAVEIKDGAPAPGAADLLGACRRALVTEVQVMVRREDEEAFAELNGAHPKFVEDAVRLLDGELGGLPGLAGYRVRCAHFESLHAHDAVACLRRMGRGD